METIKCDWCSDPIKPSDKIYIREIKGKDRNFCDESCADCYEQVESIK